jgi:MFS family permease
MNAVADLAAPEAAGDHPLARSFVVYALALMLLSGTLGSVDRQILAILAEAIKHEFHLKDWQIGALNGSAFAIFSTTLAVPIARLAERTNRPKVIGASVFLWSLFTVVCAFTTSFLTMFLARVGVGIGEAGASPSSMSLASAYVSKRRRASALAVLSMGLPMGVLLGMSLGGLLADRYGWRMGFIVAGAPGLLVGLLAAFTLVERGKHPTLDTARQVPVLAAMRELLAKRSLLMITLGATFWAFTHNAIGAFSGAFFLRTHRDQLIVLASHWHGLSGATLGPTGFLGVALGLSGGLFGVLGTLFGGWLTDRLLRRDQAAYMTVLAVTRFIGIPISTSAFLVNDVGVALMLLAVGNFLTAMGAGGLYASISSLVRPEFRATAFAAFGLVVNITAVMFGPLAAGILSDVMAAQLGPIEGLRWSLLVMNGLAMLCVFVYWGARRPLVREMVN